MLIVKQTGIIIEEINENWINYLIDNNLKVALLHREVTLKDENGEPIYIDDATESEINAGTQAIKQWCNKTECYTLLKDFLNAIDGSLQDFKELKLQEINTSYEDAILSLQKEHIPTSEMLTFETQEREAKAYKESGFSDVSTCPTMQIIAQARGVELRVLCEKALSKAELFRTASAQLIGKRQRLQDLVEIAETKEDLSEIRL